ncbi:hypothetical protein HPB52_022978 [Rhipicephalus sanguineus]|uniref:Uncharacterized protein n=1 Tax=Rhipicephalus sanguineus TaxID=34632 RepID=A0A9D4PK25_RHISA|nr:hypothetical protein HPB52_022978 [Rhipicephalus sanguineus]
MKRGREALQQLDEMAVAYFEAKGVSVPTVAEGRWATLLARQVVTPAQDKEELEAKLHDEDKQEEPEHGEKSNEGGVDPSRASEEAGWDAEDYEVNATQVDGSEIDIVDKDDIAREPGVSEKVCIGNPFFTGGKCVGIMLIAWLARHVLRTNDVPKHNELYSRYVFRTGMQRVEEQFDCFVTDLKLKACDCGFGNERENKMIGEQIVCGIYNEKTRADILKLEDPTLEKVEKGVPEDELRGQAPLL